MILNSHGEAMPHDPALRDALRQLEVATVIETGTAFGTGSTRLLADCLPNTPITTIESNKERWAQACANLAQRSNVYCMYGLSVRADEARDFIRSDPAIKNHRAYPNILIDNLAAPAEFYMAEIYTEDPERPEDLLRNLAFVAKKPTLFVLDSAGGIGLLEFQVMQEAAGNSCYAVLLDDIGHLKHFRSAQIIRDNAAEWDMVASSDRWMLAWHV